MAPDLLQGSVPASHEPPLDWYARYQLAFHNGPAPMSISTYADGRFIDVNKSFLRMIGFDREDLVGRTSRELRFWYDHSDRQRLLDQLEASGGLVRFESLPLRSKDGRRLWTEVSAQATEIDSLPCLLIIYDEHRLRDRKWSGHQVAHSLSAPKPAAARRPSGEIADAELRDAVSDAVRVIEQTRHSFKSKQLAELRRRLEGVLRKSMEFTPHH
jgi:PAS domain S-box-containing protein